MGGTEVGTKLKGPQLSNSGAGSGRAANALPGIFISCHRMKLRQPEFAGREHSQCPSCFTINLFKHLPAAKKQKQDDGWRLTCALCGNVYRWLEPQRLPRAA